MTFMQEVVVNIVRQTDSDPFILGLYKGNVMHPHEHLMFAPKTVLPGPMKEQLVLGHAANRNLMSRVRVWLPIPIRAVCCNAGQRKVILALPQGRVDGAGVMPHVCAPILSEAVNPGDQRLCFGGVTLTSRLKR